MELLRQTKTSEGHWSVRVGAVRAWTMCLLVRMPTVQMLVAPVLK